MSFSAESVASRLACSALLAVEVVEEAAFDRLRGRVGVAASHI